MGNFLSKSYGSHHSHLLRDKFKELAEIISSYNHLLIDTQFIIVPGPTDSPFANILPRYLVSFSLTRIYENNLT